MSDILLIENVLKFSGLDKTINQTFLFVVREDYSYKIPS